MGSVCSMNWSQVQDQPWVSHGYILSTYGWSVDWFWLLNSVLRIRQSNQMHPFSSHCDSQANKLFIYFYTNWTTIPISLTQFWQWIFQIKILLKIFCDVSANLKGIVHLIYLVWRCVHSELWEQQQRQQQQISTASQLVMGIMEYLLLKLWKSLCTIWRHVCWLLMR